MHPGSCLASLARTAKNVYSSMASFFVGERRVCMLLSRLYCLNLGETCSRRRWQRKFAKLWKGRRTCSKQRLSTRRLRKATRRRPQTSLHTLHSIIRRGGVPGFLLRVVVDTFWRVARGVRFWLSRGTFLRGVLGTKIAVFNFSKTVMPIRIVPRFCARG